LLDTFELPLRGTVLNLFDESGLRVSLDNFQALHEESDLYILHAKSAEIRHDAGRGIVQLLGDEVETEASMNAIVKSLLMPSIFSSSSSPIAEREGYLPISSEEVTFSKREHQSNIGGSKNVDGENIADPRVDGGTEEFRGRSYQNQLTKFNRILAHLVNDRTVLAWFRCNLAFVALSFKYMKLASAYEDKSVAWVLLLSGAVFMILLPISWWSGYRRYSKCKDLLDYDITRISSYLHKMGFDLDSSVFFVIILLSFVTICYSSTVIIWTSNGSNDDGQSNDILPG